MQQSLPRRDLWLIPLLSLLTVLVMVGAAELTSRSFWPVAEDGCWVKDPVYYARNVPNCRSSEKLAEGPWVTDQYNSCGYRSPESCGPKPAGTLRIALIGSSFSQGRGVEYDKAFAARAAELLTASCGRPVEIQNLAVVATTPIDFARRMHEALALKPDLVLVTITPFDVFSSLYTDQEMAERKVPKPLADEAGRTPKSANTLAEFKYMLERSRATTVALHYLYQNQQTYLRLFLAYGDHADYLRAPLKPMWQKRFARVDALLGDMAEDARAQSVPLAVAGGISGPLAALLSEAKKPAGTNDHVFEQKLAEITARHGIIYLDVYPAFARRPHASNLFYIVDGHLAAGGHGLFAQALADQLLAKDIPAFAGCSSRRPANSYAAELSSSTGRISSTSSTAASISMP